MTNDQFFKLFDETVERMRFTLQKKGNDYTGGMGEDRLANFKIIEHLGIAKAEQGLLCRMVDKISRITSFNNRGKLSVNESVIDAIEDIIGYAILLKALYSEKSEVSDI